MATVDTITISSNNTNDIDTHNTLSNGVNKLAINGELPSVGKSTMTQTDEERKKIQTRVWEHYVKNPNGGLHYTNHEELSKQRGVIWDVIKELGHSVLEGRELTEISLPVYLFEPKSFLEKMTEGWCYAPTFLTKAAVTTDPLERFKLVICFAVAGIHVTPAYKCRKPFNPILGETYQAKFDDGTEVYCEQTLHHPPTSNWQVIGPSNQYYFWGRGSCSASGRGNTIKGYQNGPNVVEFNDGTKIIFNLPTLYIKGVVFGDRIMEFGGSMNFIDEKNKLSCELIFNAEELGFIKGLFQKQKQTVDYVRGEIVRLGKKDKKKDNTQVLCVVEGHYLSNLDFDGKRYWDTDMLPHIIRPVEDPLPSDSHYREDLNAVLENDFVRGKECKLMLEDKQRHDAKLRQKGKQQRQQLAKKQDKKK